MDNYRYVDLGDSLNVINVDGGLINKGEYNAATNYAVGDAVSYNGSSYVMYVDAAAGTVPTNTTYWQILAAKGDTGAAGATGPQGATGPAGQGVPVGGTAGQILSKIDGTNYNTEWVDNHPSDLRHYVKNDSGGTINKGEAVYISGANGTNVLVKKALANSDATSARTLGLAATTMTTNQFGWVVEVGELTGLDTSAAGADGDPVFLSGTTAGGLIYGIANKPKAPTHLVYIGVVVKKNPSTGEIWVKVQNGYELDEIHDVQINSIQNNQVIKYDSSDSLWKNHTLVKGDVGLGNVDNTSDLNKPISTATQTALDGKVDENAAITGATKTKITYDAKGLVTAGADAAVADITGLQTALDNKLDDTQLDTDGTLAANSDSKIASQKATKTYTDTGLATKEPTITAGTTGQYWRGDKSWQTLDKSAVGLSSVDNVQQMPLSYLDTDTTLAANSDSKVPSQKAIKTYVDTQDATKVTANSAITGATKTKITYDTKGLVTAGADATTADIADSTNKRYITDAQQTVLGNTSGTNSGDVALSGEDYLSITGQAITANAIDLDNLSATGTPSNTTFLRGDNTWATPPGGGGGSGDVVGPGSSVNNNVVLFDGTTGKLIKDSGVNLSSKVDANAGITGATKTKITYDSKGLVTAGADATTADIADSTNKRYVTDAQQTVINNTSGTNTGDETQSTIKTKLGAASSGVDGYLTGTDWTTFNGKQAALGFTAENVANKDTTITLGTSNTLYPSQNAAKTYVDTNGGYATTATAAGTTTLTNTSVNTQFFTGTSTQTVKLPDATTLTVGRVFVIHNNSTGRVTVQDGNSAQAAILIGDSNAKFTVTNIGSVAGVWDIELGSEIVKTNSTSSQAGFATDTYVTGSYLKFPFLPKIGTRYKLTFDVTKTAAGTAAPIISLRVGTAGSTSDSARCTFTFTAGAAQISVGIFQVEATFRAVGTSAVLVGHAWFTSEQDSDISADARSRVTVSGTFTSTTEALGVGISYNAGTSASHTIQMVNAEIIM